MQPNALKAYWAKKKAMKEHGATYQLPVCSNCDKTIWHQPRNNSTLCTDCQK